MAMAYGDAAPVAPMQPVAANAPGRERLTRARTQYAQGVRAFEAQQWHDALHSVNGVFNLLKDSEDQASLILVMYALTLACDIKLRLGHFDSCSTLCTFLLGKTVGVASMRALQAKLVEIRQSAYMAQGDANGLQQAVPAFAGAEQPLAGEQGDDDSDEDCTDSMEWGN